MTPSCDTCQLDFRPGEEADMETWERDGVARCRACAREFAALWQWMDHALDAALAFIGPADLGPLPDGFHSGGIVSGGREVRVGEFGAECFIPGPVQVGSGYFPGGVTIHSRSRPHG